MPCWTREPRGFPGACSRVSGSASRRSRPGAEGPAATPPTSGRTTAGRAAAAAAAAPAAPAARATAATTRPPARAAAAAAPSSTPRSTSTSPTPSASRTPAAVAAAARAAAATAGSSARPTASPATATSPPSATRACSPPRRAAAPRPSAPTASAASCARPAPAAARATWARLARPTASGTVTNNCDPPMGEACDAATGTCTGDCANLGTSYIGCEYYAVTMSNSAARPGDVPRSRSRVSNTSATKHRQHHHHGPNATHITDTVAAIPAGGIARVPSCPGTPRCRSATPRRRSSPAGAYHILTTEPVAVYQFNPRDYTLARLLVHERRLAAHARQRDDAELLRRRGRHVGRLHRASVDVVIDHQTAPRSPTAAPAATHPSPAAAWRRPAARR